MKDLESLQRHVILNDKVVNGKLHLGTDNKFQIISLPSMTSDFQKGTASLHRLLVASTSQNEPVKLDGERLADTIILEEHNASVSPTLKSISIEAKDDISLHVP